MNSLVSRTMVSGEANASDCQVGNGAEATPEPSSLPRSAIAGADTKDIRLALHKKEVAVEFAAMFLDGYLTPAFGARTKPEIDLLVLGCLIKAKAVDPGAPLYDLARALNITPSKVRALILNWQLRSTEREVDLRQALAAAVVKTRFAKDGALLTFGIENPLLRAEVEARLKRKGVFADASFSREIIRMPVEAFVEFLDDIVEESAKRDLWRITRCRTAASKPWLPAFSEKLEKKWRARRGRQWRANLSIRLRRWGSEKPPEL